MRHLSKHGYFADACKQLTDQDKCRCNQAAPKHKIPALAATKSFRTAASILGAGSSSAVSTKPAACSKEQSFSWIPGPRTTDTGQHSAETHTLTSLTRLPATKSPKAAPRCGAFQLRLQPGEGVCSGVLSSAQGAFFISQDPTKKKATLRERERDFCKAGASVTGSSGGSSFGSGSSFGGSFRGSFGSLSFLGT